MTDHKVVWPKNLERDVPIESEALHEAVQILQDTDPAADPLASLLDQAIGKSGQGIEEKVALGQLARTYTLQFEESWMIQYIWEKRSKPEAIAFLMQLRDGSLTWELESE